MEIFQTIWTALITENEALISIIAIPFGYLELFLSILLANSLLNLNINRKNILLYVLIIPTISVFAGLYISPTAKVIINLISTPLYAKFILKIGFFKGILIELLSIIIMLIAETIWFNFIHILFGITSNQVITIPIYKIIIAFLDYLSLFIVYMLSKKYNFNTRLLDNLTKGTKRILTTNFVIGLIAVITQVYLVSFYSETLPLFITIIGLLSLLAYFFISMYSLANTSKLALATTNLELEKENNRILKEMQDELHGFRHDFSNIMCTIGGYVQVKDIYGLTKYYSQIQKDVVKINNLGALNSEVINNPAIFILISSKYSKALELGINMNINVFLDLNKLNMKIYEFTRVLGILLDNAIEAAKDCDEKIINIEIRKESKRNRQLLLIENTYSNKNVDTEKIFEKKYSTKEGNSGLGLWEVRKILSRNSNLNLFTTKDNNYFTQQLEMYNN